MTTPHTPPDWAFEFHGHRCPFMPIGYRMGKLAMERLGVEREKDHGFFVFPEIGEGHPQTCMADGLQAATGATYGKTVMAKTFYGKLAAVFYHPREGRRALRPQADVPRRLRRLRVLRLPQARRRALADPRRGHRRGGRLDLRAVRRRRCSSSQDLPDFTYSPVKGSFNKTLCSSCGEYVFDRYVRVQGRRPVCIPCSGYEPDAAAEVGESMNAHRAVIAGAGDARGTPDLQILADDMAQAIELESAPVAVFLLAPDADMAPFADWQAGGTPPLLPSAHEGARRRSCHPRGRRVGLSGSRPGLRLQAAAAGPPDRQGPCRLRHRRRGR